MRKDESACPGEQVEGDRHHLRGAQACRRNEEEIRQKGARGGAGRVDGVEHRNLPAARGLDVMSDAMTDEQGEGAAHQHRNRRE